MLIVLILIAIAAIVLGIICDDNNYDGAAFVLILCGCLLGIACGIGIVVSSIGISQSMVIDDKIAMYEEENLAIENDIDGLVISYMDYEEKVHFTAASGNYMTLISMYPDLKADSLVQEQIRIHTENNEKIKALKEEKLDMAVCKWWLFFGK